MIDAAMPALSDSTRDDCGNADCGRSRKRRFHSCSDRTVADECPVRRCGIGRYHQNLALLARDDMTPALKELLLMSVEDIGHFKRMFVHRVRWPPGGVVSWRMGRLSSGLAVARS